jgi:nucleoside-diphosphate-sugar epimerase
LIAAADERNLSAATSGSVARDRKEQDVILVIGGKSKIGSALIEPLLARGEEVRALVRDMESAAAFPAAVEAVTGDLASPDSLAAAMTGAEKVFLLSSPHLSCGGIATRSTRPA